MLMNKHFFSCLGLILLTMIGFVPMSIAQDARTLLVVDLQGSSAYSADDMNQLQWVISPFRKQYGIAVQGYDKDLGGYVLFSSRTKLDQITTSEMNQLQTAIKEIYPYASFSVKTQQAVVHKPQSEKIGSSEAGKNRNPKIQQPKR
jgi:hypothetical protein